MKYNIVKDKYSKVREGSSKFNIIICSKCEKEIFLYQKDGSGKLLRMYIDRFVAPENIASEIKKSRRKGDMPELNCPHCGELLGVPMIYTKENRLAYRIITNKIKRKEAQSPFEFEI